SIPRVTSSVGDSVGVRKDSGGDLTSPIVRLIERGVEPNDLAMASRLRREVGGDPHLLAARLIRAIETEKQSSGDDLRDQLEQAVKSQEDRLDELERKSTRLETTTGWWKWLLGGVGAIALALLVYVVDKILSRVELEGEAKMK